MKSFLDPYAVLFKKILELLPKSLSLQISATYDYSSFFEKNIADFFKQQPRVILDEFVQLPGFWFSKIKIVSQGFLIGSFGVAESKHDAVLLSQAEFLERVSSWIPLDGVRRKNFFTDNAQTNTKLVVKSIIRFTYKKVKRSDLYWGLAETKETKRQVTTSGIAGHFIQKNAILNAWLELIERDSFLVHWLNTISPPKIDISCGVRDKELELLLDSCKKNEIEVHLLDITSDLGVPVCLAIVSKNDKAALGAKAGFSQEWNIKKALLEALVVHASMAGMVAKDLPADFTPFSDERVDKVRRLESSFSEHGRQAMTFLFSSEKSVAIEPQESCTLSVGEQIARLKGIFSQRYSNNRDYDVFVYFFKNKLTHTFNFSVVRVICDALYPMYLSEHFADPSHPRLQEFVKNRGLEKIAKLNSFPHPFS